MTDNLSKPARSRAMSRVRCGDTKPEWILRCGLHRLGFRFRLRDEALPGRPDLVFPKYGAALFVHGCYWHRHTGCKDATTPKSNTGFWLAKFEENTRRDEWQRRELEALGWRVLIVWECDLVKSTATTIENVARWLTDGSIDQGRFHRMISCIDRESLLSVAEAKVRYRLSGYDKTGSMADRGSLKEPKDD